MSHDKRTMGTMLDDKGIELKALHTFATDPDLAEDAHVVASSMNRLVLLTGQVPTERLKERAGALIQAMPSVRHVYNQLQIAPPTAPGVRAQDTWITTQVKTKIWARPAYRMSRIRVITEDHVVYLLGITSHRDAQGIAAVAQGVPGVRRVVRVFEYS